MEIKSAEIFDRNWKKYDDWFEKHKDIYFTELKTLRNAIPEGLGLEIGVHFVSSFLKASYLGFAATLKSKSEIKTL